MSVYNITTVATTSTTTVTTTTATVVTATITAATTSAPAIAATPESAPSWIEFCERHAHASASDFAKAFCTYVSLNLSESARSSLSHRDFLRKFVENFCEHFESEYFRRTRSSSMHDAKHMTLNERDAAVAIQNNNVPIHTSSHEEFSDYSEQDSETVSPKSTYKPFFRRLSFKGLKKGKSFFHKQQSDEVELSHCEHHRDKHTKIKLSKIIVECRKEGIVNSLIEHNEETNKWKKSRLALIKAIGGYMIELYSPPKDIKPSSGVFCSELTEARETTALEMPDHENTFVLKTGTLEFVIEAHDSNDMRSWLATIKYCMRTGHHSSTTPNFGVGDSIADSLGHASISSDSDRLRANSVSKSSRSTVQESIEEVLLSPPELPPRLHVRSSSNLELCSSQHEIEELSANDSELDQSNYLREYPWFHGTLPRSDAAHLVLHNTVNGHGVFLVRQSETRKGEFVLTFNFQGRAKHLRMTLNDQGHCRVQHLCFPAIHDMLEYFRENAIPLESGGTSDVMLTEYVICNCFRTVYNNPSGTNMQQSQDRRSPYPLQYREIQTYGGSVRARVNSLERMGHFGIMAQQSSSTGRAVQNNYSFL